MGDLDSLRSDVCEFYSAGGTAVTSVAGQDTNDFEKCLLHIETLASSTPEGPIGTTVVAVGAFGGRFDQEMAAMHLLYKYAPRFERSVLLGDGNMCFLLNPCTTHSIRTDLLFEGPTCGVLPIGGPSTVTSKGLKWDMNKMRLEFGNFVSSSNCISDSEIVIRVGDSPIVWMTEFRLERWLELCAYD